MISAEEGGCYCTRPDQPRGHRRPHSRDSDTDLNCVPFSRVTVATACCCLRIGVTLTARYPADSCSALSTAALSVVVAFAIAATCFLAAATSSASLNGSALAILPLVYSPPISCRAPPWPL